MRQIASRLLWFEPLIMLATVYAFWFPDPNRIWSLLLLLPFLALRFVAFGRLLTHTPLNVVYLAFLILGVINVFTAPMSRGNVTLTVPVVAIPISVPWAWLMLGRPIAGMAVYFILVEWGRRHGMRAPLLLTVALALGIALLALVASQWNSKSALLDPFIEALPVIRDLPFARGGFNANEIAGAMTWLTPLCAGLALMRWSPLQVLASTAFWLLFLAVFLGQSRLSIVGIVLGLLAVILLRIPRGRQRLVALAGLALFIIAEAAVVLNVFAPPARVAAVQEREFGSQSRRFEMWTAALDIVRDHPFTGVGMNMYRDGQVRALYPVTDYERRVLPHTHNELLQIATDLGIPGFILFAAWHVVIARMLFATWQRGDDATKTVVAACAAGLLAHAVFGMGDAITLWDRFIWVFWWVTGIAGAQYVVVRQQEQNVAISGDP